MRRQGLKVASLALGVQRVEDQRTLAAARHARDDGQLAVRDGNGDTGEVVFSNIVEANRRARHAASSVLPRRFASRRLLRTVSNGLALLGLGLLRLLALLASLALLNLPTLNLPLGHHAFTRTAHWRLLHATTGGATAATNPLVAAQSANCLPHAARAHALLHARTTLQLTNTRPLRHAATTLAPLASLAPLALLALLAAVLAGSAHALTQLLDAFAHSFAHSFAQFAAALAILHRRCNPLAALLTAFAIAFAATTTTALLRVQGNGEEQDREGHQKGHCFHLRYLRSRRANNAS